ncbi:MAG TPA: hypothetical protein VNM72_01985 [Blastocatellia bacterium]|nr:hypothetical protein [Blastocatellia bacterium]
MKRVVAFALGVGLLGAGYVAYRSHAQDSKTSFQVGDSTPAFDVLDVTGPNKGKQLCYV